jgi:PIN domain nuclease of toxin-antitoxin system
MTSLTTLNAEPLLLDTQCWLWMQAAPGRLAPSARERLEEPDTTLYFSAASAWEISIKFAIGKLRLPERPVDYVESRLRAGRTSSLTVSVHHAAYVAELPPIHRDPFDRLLIAQAIIEKLPIMTSDAVFKRYGIEVIDA